MMSLRSSATRSNKRTRTITFRSQTLRSHARQQAALDFNLEKLDVDTLGMILKKCDIHSVSNLRATSTALRKKIDTLMTSSLNAQVTCFSMSEININLSSIFNNTPEGLEHVFKMMALSGVGDDAPSVHVELDLYTWSFNNDGLCGTFHNNVEHLQMVLPVLDSLTIALPILAAVQPFTTLRVGEPVNRLFDPYCNLIKILGKNADDCAITHLRLENFDLASMCLEPNGTPRYWIAALLQRLTCAEFINTGVTWEMIDFLTECQTLELVAEMNFGVEPISIKNLTKLRCLRFHSIFPLPDLIISDMSELDDLSIHVVNHAEPSPFLDALVQPDDTGVVTQTIAVDVETFVSIGDYAVHVQNLAPPARQVVVIPPAPIDLSFVNGETPDSSLHLEEDEMSDDRTYTLGSDDDDDTRLSSPRETIVISDDEDDEDAGDNDSNVSGNE